MCFKHSNPVWLLFFSGWMLCGSGCANAVTDALPYWPFGDRERTNYLTPAKRIDQMQALAATAGQKSASEQEAIAADLAAQIKQEEDPLIREEIIRTLAKYPTTTSRAVIMAGLKDFDPYVRIAAIGVLAESGDAEVADQLAKLVQSDADVDVRLAATDALGKFQGPAVMPALALALDDTDPALQHRAIQSLKSSSGQDFGNDVSAWRQYARGETPPAKRPTSLAEQLQSLSPF